MKSLQSIEMFQGIHQYKRDGNKNSLFNMVLKLYAQSNILVIGATGSGKTTAILSIIKRKLVTPAPDKIYFMYAAHQPFMDTWNEDPDNQKIEFIEGLKLEVLDEYKGPKLLVIDDLILSLSRDLVNHFLAGSHHKNTTTIFTTHSVFLNNDMYRLISNNSQYIMLFKNKRNLSQVKLLAHQILEKESNRLLEAYKYIAPYEFVLISCHPKVPDELLVTADFFKQCQSVFLQS